MRARARPGAGAGATSGSSTFINGPESFTPDGNFILGEAPEVTGFFVGAGFNAFGIAAGGGAGHGAGGVGGDGRAALRSVGGRHPPLRAAATATPWVRTRTLEAYAKHYAMAWPHDEYRLRAAAAAVAAL